MFGLKVMVANILELTVVSSRITIPSGNFKLNRSIRERCLANYRVLWPLMNLTRINRQMNIAYISALLLQTSVAHLYAYSMLLISLPLDVPILVLSVFLAFNCGGENPSTSL